MVPVDLMKPAHRKIVLERMQGLMDSAIYGARSNPARARRHAMLARRLGSRHNIRMPYQMRMAFCRRCKSFIAPGVDSRIRVGRSPIKSVRISCKICGHVYRKIIPVRHRRVG